jgi:hypothetical protein
MKTEKYRSLKGRSVGLVQYIVMLNSSEVGSKIQYAVHINDIKVKKLSDAYIG